MPNTFNYMNSPNLEHIIDNYLTININLSAFFYFNNSSSLQYDPTIREIVNILTSHRLIILPITITCIRICQNLGP